MKRPRLVVWTGRLLAALILLQTLFFKFTAAPESVAIFTQLGVEPWGRLATGVLELLAAALLLWPRRPATGWYAPRAAVLGAALALGLMTGALAAHLLVLGIESQGDGGQLFAYALTVAGASLLVLFFHRRPLLKWLAAFTNRA
jgi:hypothetical protein